MRSIWKDKHGKVVIAQRPNAPMIVWFVTFLLGWLPLPELYLELFGLVSFGAIFTWAWMEIATGVNLFRRMLGAVIMCFVVIIRLI